MDAFCLIVAGVVRASVPGPEFTLSWQHSVEKVRWEERYRISGDHLILAEARVQGSGAGMEPPPEAVLRGGTWSWQPRRELAELKLTYSRFAPDYRVCWQRTCRRLGALAGPLADGTVVVLRPCAREGAVSPRP